MVNHIFEKFLNEKTASFDSYMAEFFGEGTHPDMWRYLYGPLSEFSNNAGKRHRPLICMLACRAVGGDDQMARAAGHSAFSNRNFAACRVPKPMK